MSVLSSTAAAIPLRALRGAARLAPGWFEKALFAFAEKGTEAIPYPQGRMFAGQMLRFAQQILPTGCHRCRVKVLDNLVLGSIAGKRQRLDYRRRTGLQPPYLLVISPSMRCNLRCIGCYAARYAKDDEMPFDLLDRILNEAEAMGITFITISGGEPFARADLLDLYAAHERMYFMVYTNGTLIDDRLADRLAALGHVMPCISVEGFEAETDRRRGRGTHQRILSAMERLHRRGVFFGFSATATRQNNDTIVSDEFIDFYRDRGCVAGWYFNYIPIGKEPDLSLMPTPEQRIHRRRRLRKLRARLPMLLMDFWNDGALVGGCMAAGRYYLHINVHGDVEPCVFAQFAVDNIRGKSLHEVLESPFFRTVREQQPFSGNHLRACMIIDHPQILRDAVRRHGARAAYDGGEALLEKAADGLDAYAAHWARLADSEWLAEGSDDLEHAEHRRRAQ